MHTGESVVNLSSKARLLGHAMQKLPKRGLEFQGHQVAYDLTPTLGVALCCPFLQPTRHCCLLLTRSDGCLFPGAWNGGGGNAAGPGRLNLPGKAKRGSTTVPAQLQLRASRSRAKGRSHWLHRISGARVGGEDVLHLLRRDNGWTLWLAKEKACVVG